MWILPLFIYPPPQYMYVYLHTGIVYVIMNNYQTMKRTCII